MASFTKPISSSIGEINFGFLLDEEISSVSVKRIYNTPTLDSLNNPVPGGLYDPALGSWGDHVYAIGFILVLVLEGVIIANIVFLDVLLAV